LAHQYLGDSTRAFLIREFNGLETLTAGDYVVIPLQPFRLGGLHPNGYQTVPVLCYHQFSKSDSNKMTVTEYSFQKQMDFLKKENYAVISLEQLIQFIQFDTQIPEKAVVITIDDGWKSFYDIAFPVLKKHNYPATLFLYTGFVRGKKGLTWEQLQDLKKHNIDVQVHSHTHRYLDRKQKGESFEHYFKAILTELNKPKELIERNLDTTCHFLAYPYGETNQLVIELAKKINYKAGLTVNRQSNPFFNDRFRINRAMIYGDGTFKDFQDNLNVFVETELQ
jgi:peptidoglycan/xylan/chitin deacetylase (PgdA/CDA1 family)